MSSSPKLAPHGPLSLILATLTAACLGVSGYVHLDLAHNYVHNKASGTLSQGDLFRLQGIGVIVVAIALLASVILIKGRVPTLVFALAAVTMAGSFAAVLITRYYDPGKILFIPDMYEPVWYHEKTLSAVVEGLGTLLALGGAATGFLRRPTSAA